MKIHGITTCVGELYAGYLARSLHVWLETLDSLTIATSRPFPNSATYPLLTAVQVQPVDRWFKMKANWHFLPTNTFTAAGAHFNKGAGLNAAFAAAAPDDWVLSFDCDIIPPPDWREVVERSAEAGCLHGCWRHAVGSPFRRSRRIRMPLGYFQLWHVADPCASPPPFTEIYPHAGGYDADFAERWPRDRWRELPFTVGHQGESRRNWFGVGRDQEMRELLAANAGRYSRGDKNQRKVQHGG